MNTSKSFWKLVVLASQLVPLASFAGSGPAANPYLAAKVYATTHFDSAQSDAFPYAVPKGVFNVDLSKVQRTMHGPVNIITLASTDENHMWGSSSSGVTYIDVSNNGFKELAFFKPDSAKEVDGAKLDRMISQKFTKVSEIENAVIKDLKLDWTILANGTYALVDKDNTYYGTFGRNLVHVGLKDKNNPSAGIALLGSRDLSELTSHGEHLVGVNMLYDGHLAVLSNTGIIVMDRDLGKTLATFRFAKGELATNSFAVDQKNAIYVASDMTMYKLAWNGKYLSAKESDGGWSAAYDYGTQPPTVKLGRGTGSTPTLMGFEGDSDKLVVITDGADHMKLVAFWRDQIPKNFKQVSGARSKRIAGQLPITVGFTQMPKYIQTEQSVVTKGYGAFVVNNIAEKGEKDKLVDVIALGPINKPGTGVERAEWNPQTHTWKSVWTRNDIVSISMVPAVSTPSDIVFINGYTKKDGWEVTGLDWNTGKTVHRTIFGQDNRGNGAYAIIQAFPNGDLLFNSIVGPSRVPLKNQSQSLTQNEVNEER